MSTLLQESGGPRARLRLAGQGGSCPGLGGLHDRLNAVVGPLPFWELAARTGYNRETVRRYLRGGMPPVGFIVTVSVVFDCSLNWLLLGCPPRAASDVVRAHLLQSTLSDLSGMVEAAREHRLRDAPRPRTRADSPLPPSRAPAGKETGRSRQHFKDPHQAARNARRIP